jgi:uncharacterized protein YqhQ
MAKKANLGGQAVIEGVMIRSPKSISVAVRKEDGSIKVKKQHYKSLVDRCIILKLPVLRGIIYLFEMLVLAMKALTYSAEEATGEEEKLTTFELFLTIFLAVVFVLLIFVAAPYYLAKLSGVQSRLLFNAIDGAVRLVLFFAYLILISLMKDIKRLYQYHGAEHKTVHCYEAGKELIVANVKKYSTLHPRCGTSFLVIVLAISIILFSLIKDPRWYVNIPFRILLVPVIAGISYELLKLSARYEKSPLAQLIIAPGLWVQKLTTREPDKKQMEVAIAAVKKVM